MGLPGVSGDVSGEVVEEILTVVEIEDGEAAVGIAEVGFGQVDGDGALGWFGKDGGVEAMPLEAGDVGEARALGGIGFGVFRN